MSRQSFLAKLVYGPPMICALIVIGTSLGGAGFGYIVFPFQQTPLNAAIGGALMGASAACYYLVAKLLVPKESPNGLKGYRK